MKIVSNLIILFSVFSFSQVLQPVQWTTSIESIAADEYDIVFTAGISSGWHLYSQHVPEDGPLPTRFTFVPSEAYRVIGQPSEEKGKEVYEEVFQMTVTYFEHKAVFKQRIKRIHTNPFTLEGIINYMSCNNESCLPGQFKFQTSIN
ncbi:protein-disulfide reductase DsbD domain-containing protein [Cognatitamlana onchidii]|uniref:protein-disulfide reductase DsbD domain-containing protein n=1 Tax=Cognatitamlana onchidii TaxID=2562860 RepID=UPI0010A63A9B|nr:protein-disulfide reductase DsbD domain-containing protein [Algibacter onchidii]